MFPYRSCIQSMNSNEIEALKLSELEDNIVFQLWTLNPYKLLAEHRILQETLTDYHRQKEKHQTPILISMSYVSTRLPYNGFYGFIPYYQLNEMSKRGDKLSSYI